MAEYSNIEIESDPDVLMDEALQMLALNIPGFVAREAHLEVWVLETIARMIAETRYLFGQIPDGIFQYFGESMVGVPPVQGVRAEATTTWTMIDNAGYTVTAGTQIGYRVAGDRVVVFETVADFTVAPGQTSQANVVVRAPAVGTAYNGFGPSNIELIDSLAFVDTITSAAATAGGVDPETDEAYLDRLRDELSLLSPSFVLATDAAILARRINGVARALGIDNYNPTNSTYGNEKMITVAVVGANGLALSTGVKNAVKAYLESLRELNFVVHVIDPTYTSVAVTFTAKAEDGFTPSVVEAAAELAVTEYLSSANWAGGNESPPRWRTGETVVRYLEVAEVINRVEGLRYITALTLNGGTADINLTGAAPLAQPGTIAGTVVA